MKAVLQYKKSKLALSYIEINKQKNINIKLIANLCELVAERYEEPAVAFKQVRGQNANASQIVLGKLFLAEEAGYVRTLLIDHSQHVELKISNVVDCCFVIDEQFAQKRQVCAVYSDKLVYCI